MKILLLLLAFTFTQSDKESKQAEKERLKRPAEITIKAPLAKVRSLLLIEYARAGWQTDKDSDSVLIFSTSDIQTRMGYNSAARREDRFTLTDTGAGVLVIADLGVAVPRFGGAVQRFNWNQDKKQRRRIDDLFARVKADAEAAGAASTAPPVSEWPKTEADAKPTPTPAPKKTCIEGGVKVPCS